jgi:hypothetical protein
MEPELESTPRSDLDVVDSKPDYVAEYERHLDSKVEHEAELVELRNLIVDKNKKMETLQGQLAAVVSSNADQVDQLTRDIEVFTAREVEVSFRSLFVIYYYLIFV